MAEIPDVITGEVISSNWGNDIRDRTVQRYATVAARSAAIPTPNEGDMSWLQDANALDVYNGATWVPFIGTNELDGANDVVTASLTTSMADVASVSLTVPAGWDSWKCEASATGAFSGLNSLFYRLRIDGTDGPETTFDLTGIERGSIAASWRRTGLTTTGSSSISLRSREGGPGNITLSNIHLYARAVRTS